jgi:hypothetical protein
MLYGTVLGLKMFGVVTLFYFRNALLVFPICLNLFHIFLINLMMSY